MNTFNPESHPLLTISGAAVVTVIVYLLLVAIGIAVWLATLLSIGLLVLIVSLAFRNITRTDRNRRDRFGRINGTFAGRVHDSDNSLPDTPSLSGNDDTGISLDFPDFGDRTGGFDVPDSGSPNNDSGGGIDCPTGGGIDFNGGMNFPDASSNIGSGGGFDSLSMGN